MCDKMFLLTADFLALIKMKTRLEFSSEILREKRICTISHRSRSIRQLGWAIRQHANDASIWKRIEEEQQKQREKSTVWRCCFVGVYLFVLRKKIKPRNATFLSLCGEKRKKARIHFRKGAIVADTYARDLLGERKVFDEKVQKRLLKVLPV